jgi:hypothetical protein
MTTTYLDLFVRLIDHREACNMSEQLLHAILPLILSNEPLGGSRE